MWWDLVERNGSLARGGCRCVGANSAVVGFALGGQEPRDATTAESARVAGQAAIEFRALHVRGEGPDVGRVSRTVVEVGGTAGDVVFVG